MPFQNHLVRLIIVCGFIILGTLSVLAGRRSLKRYDSPDKSLYAVVLTLSDEALGLESNIELRRSNGDLIGLKRFVSKDRAHGLGIVKAKWSFDSNFFVFSTIASGGREAGKFPTFFFSRRDAKIHALDPAVGKWITDPEFHLQAGDLITVIVHDTLANGSFADTLTRTVHLGELPR